MDNIIYKVNLKGTEYQVAATYDVSNNNIEDTYLKKSDMGTPEDFIFTLEDGTKVTKSIRVLSTTTNQAEA